MQCSRPTCPCRLSACTWPVRPRLGHAASLPAGEDGAGVSIPCAFVLDMQRPASRDNDLAQNLQAETPAESASPLSAGMSRLSARLLSCRGQRLSLKRAATRCLQPLMHTRFFPVVGCQWYRNQQLPNPQSAGAGSQYLCLQSMLDELSAFSLRQPNAHLRPLQRPQGGPAARRWWRYAIRATLRGTGASTLSWPALHKVSPSNPGSGNAACVWGGWLCRRLPSAWGRAGAGCRWLLAFVGPTCVEPGCVD